VNKAKKDSDDMGKPHEHNDQAMQAFRGEEQISSMTFFSHMSFSMSIEQGIWMKFVANNINLVIKECKLLGQEKTSLSSCPKANMIIRKAPIAFTHQFLLIIYGQVHTKM
jgi:hypothetical protein